MATADPRPHLMAPLLARPERGAILTDYDGTLSPIVDDPFGADPLPGASDVLARLATRFGRVGVVSGRPAAFLLRHFGGRGLFLSGLYGLEQVVGDGVVVNDDAVEWAPTVEEVAARTEAHGPSGLFVERKGLSVTLH